MEFSDLKGMFGEVKTRMDAGIERVRRDMANVRTGRATIGLLDGVHAEAYGSRMPINQLATLSIPEPALMVAQPFDPSLMGAIEKAIRSSDLGLNPVTAGEVIRIPMPMLTEETRKGFIRQARHEAESARVSVRSARRDAMAMLKELVKEKDISEDDERRGQDDVQKLTDSFVAKIEKLLAEKEADLMEI